MTRPAGSPAPAPRPRPGAALATGWVRWRALVSRTGPVVWVVGALLLVLVVVALARGEVQLAVAPVGALGVVAAGTRLVVGRPARPPDARAEAQARAEAAVRARVREELARACDRDAAPPVTGRAGPLQYRSWDLDRGRPSGEPLTTAEAGAAFDAGEPVTVLVGPADAPASVLEVSDRGRRAVVTHLDRLQRPSVRYLWAVPAADSGWPQDRLLLHTAVVHAYPPERRPPDLAPSTTETYRSTADGWVRGQRVHLPSGEVSHTEHHDPAELQVEDVPVFGAWSALLDRERTTTR